MCNGGLSVMCKTTVKGSCLQHSLYFSVGVFVPHLPQNLALLSHCVPHLLQNKPVCFSSLFSIPTGCSSSDDGNSPPSSQGTSVSLTIGSMFTGSVSIGRIVLLGSCGKSSAGAFSARLFIALITNVNNIISKIPIIAAIPRYFRRVQYNSIFRNTS